MDVSLTASQTFQFTPLQRTDCRVAVRLPLQQKEGTSTVLNSAQSLRPNLCHPNVWRDNLVSSLSLSCRGFQGLCGALQELILFYKSSSYTACEWYMHSHWCKDSNWHYFVHVFKPGKLKNNQSQEWTKSIWNWYKTQLHRGVERQALQQYQ